MRFYCQVKIIIDVFYRIKEFDDLWQVGSRFPIVMDYLLYTIGYSPRTEVPVKYPSLKTALLIVLLYP